MCGICGQIGLDSSIVIDPKRVKAMMDILSHRGPDDQGIYIHPQAVLGHRRLSILDLNTGRQPISNENGRVWIVFNGEVYNYLELRQELLTKGHQFRTNTDTEVIIHLYEEYGPDCVSRLHGMFVFALWDDDSKTFLLARDRVGIKPAYYCVADRTFFFASEIKGLLTDPRVSREANVKAVHCYLSHLYCPGPETLFQGVNKLEPGHYLLVRDGKLTVRRYWDLTLAAEKMNVDPGTVSRELVELLRETVRGHMISDVPVGVLLSGGVDSTAMLSFAVEQTGQAVKTFTIGFAGASVVDERPYARLAAERYGSEHYETTISAPEFRDFLPRYVWHMEEPVCEPPAVALYYVTRLAREHVKVLISGEGGDEVFAGYQNYRNMMWLERFKGACRPLASLASVGLEQLSRLGMQERLRKYASLMRLPLPDYYYSRTAGPFSPLNRTRGSLYSPSFCDQLESVNGSDFMRSLFHRVRDQDALDQMLYVDTKTWLPDDLLLKADKITMANSLELRVPLLDHRVLEFAAGLPTNLKVRGFGTKHILKKALRDRIPLRILNRPKTGFPVPYESWLKNELKDFVRDVLEDRRTMERGYFQPAGVQALVDQALAGDGLGPELFSLVILELWHRQFVDAPPSAATNGTAPAVLSSR